MSLPKEIDNLERVLNSCGADNFKALLPVFKALHAGSIDKPHAIAMVSKHTGYPAKTCNDVLCCGLRIVFHGQIEEALELLSVK